MVGEINTVIQCEEQASGDGHRSGSYDLCWALLPLRGGGPGEVCGIAQGAPLILGYMKSGICLPISPAILNELFTTVPFRSKLLGTSSLSFQHVLPQGIMSPQVPLSHHITSSTV